MSIMEINEFLFLHAISLAEPEPAVGRYIGIYTCSTDRSRIRQFSPFYPLERTQKNKSLGDLFCVILSSAI